ncbi:tetratricopeptide repeat protein [bacterium SCSIO 12643]|nr:tetratricopeptide repeat protein [bacterium SCSIO 12643]
MSRFLLVLIVSVLGYQTLNAQNLNGKKLLKSVQKLEQNKQYGEGIQLIQSNIDSTDKMFNQIVLKLVELQVKLRLLDLAKINLSGIKNVSDVAVEAKSKELSSEIEAQKNKYNTEVALGRKHVYDREFAKANEAFQEALKYDTGNYEVWFRMGEQEHYTGSVQKAEELYKKSLKKHFDKEEGKSHVYVHLAEVYIIQRNFESAVEMCDVALKINKKEDEALFIRGQALYFQGDYARASINFTGFIKSNPKSILAYNMRGNCYMEMERYSSAIVDYSETLKLDSNMHDALSNRGRCYYFLKQYDKAIKDFDKMTESYDGNYKALNALGLCYYQKGNYKKAVYYFEQVTTISSIEAYKFNLAISYYRNNQFKLALRYFNELGESRRNQPNYNVGHTWVLISLKQYEKARTWLDASMKMNPHVKEYYELSAELYTKVGEKEKAEKELKIAHKISGDALNFDPVF